MKSEATEAIRRAAVVLDTEAEDLYERACLTTDKRTRNKLMEKRAKLSRVSRELLEVTDLVGTRQP